VNAPVRINAATAEVVAELAVLSALHIAGRRGRLPRHCADEANRLPGSEVHIRFRLAADSRDCDRLLAGAWDNLRVVLPHEHRLRTAVDWYVRQLILEQRPHVRAELHKVVAVAYE
jgi:hypothetical protein